MSSSSLQPTAEQQQQQQQQQQEHQKQDAVAGFRSTPGAVALVTGSSGMCGTRLVEFLLERGAAHVIGMDVIAPTASVVERFHQAAAAERRGVSTANDTTAAAAAAVESKFTLLTGSDGDITSDVACSKVFQNYQKIDIVYHLAGFVGPLYDTSQCEKVNYIATVRLIQMCQVTGVTKFVYRSCPSTRFTTGVVVNMNGRTEEELPMPNHNKWLTPYAETKARGEMAVSAACQDCHGDTSQPVLLTVSVAPHQVYGPADELFLPAFLQAAGSGWLRIYGSGDNLCSVTAVDNYAHGLLCAADALQPEAACLGKFYIVTDDGPPANLWDFINQAVTAMGFVDLRSQWTLPVWLLYILAAIAELLDFFFQRNFILNRFHVTMMTIHRYFDISAAQRDLQYQPLKTTDEAWSETIAWFQKHWLPGFLGTKRRRRGKGSRSLDSKQD